jgi:hypothetical protein
MQLKCLNIEGNVTRDEPRAAWSASFRPFGEGVADLDESVNTATAKVL